jgi:hypothetical protein
MDCNPADQQFRLPTFLKPTSKKYLSAKRARQQNGILLNPGTIDGKLVCEIQTSNGRKFERYTNNGF